MRDTLSSLIGLLWFASLSLAQTPEPPVGFFNSYPSVETGMEEVMPKTGASLVTCIAGGFSMNPDNGRYDFSVLDKQIEYAARNNLPLSIISELNPLFTPPWLVQKARAAGELVRNGSDVEGAIPSTMSSVFSRAQEQLVERVLEHVRRHPKGKIVKYVHPGAEWWFPYAVRYHPADVAQFRQWLSRRYGSIAELNRAWDAKYGSFDQVNPPRIDATGSYKGTKLLSTVALDRGYQDCSWSTSQATDPKAIAGEGGVVKVIPGRRYTFSVWAKGDGVAGRGGYLELAWVGNEGGPAVQIDSSGDWRPGNDWQELSVTAVAPKNAGRAWLLLKFAGTGSVVFDEVQFREESESKNLAPNGGFETGTNAPENWSFQNWTGGKNVESAYRKQGGRANSACVEIQVKALAPEVRGFANDHAAVYDWTTFWYETAAEYVNRMSALVKRFEPKQTTVSYLTYSFAFPAEWDYTQQVAIAPDEVAHRGKSIDVIGMQLCSADGDPHRTTACLDVVRKYGKPMWVVDLIDFTSGVHIGLPAMEQATQAAVAHGAEGIVYCGWHLTFVQDYSYWPRFPADGLRRMQTMAREGIKRTRGLKVKPEAALVHTMMPMSPLDGPDGKNDFRSFVGWYKVLEAMHETFDVVTLREVERDPALLARYRYIVVPDCPHLPRRAMESLKTYADKGGLLVTTNRFGAFDQFGRPMPENMRKDVKRAEVADDGRAYAGVLNRDTHAGNTPPLFLWREATPQTEAALANAKQSLRQAKEKAGILPAVELTASNLRCVRWTGEGRELVYLVNMNKAAAEGGELIARDAPSGEVRVLADLAATPCRTSVEKGVLRVILPKFTTCCVIEVVKPVRADSPKK